MICHHSLSNYFEVPSNNPNETVDVRGSLFDDWYTICDRGYHEPNLPDCSSYWQVCNPENDKNANKRLQRGGGNRPGYLPNLAEVMIAIAPPSYDAPNANGDYLIDSPRASFRSRLEGWNRICSAEQCVGDPVKKESHMHNVVHLWIGGHMLDVPSAVNDPIFSIHHCNIDRIFESWIKRFTGAKPLPGYEPMSGGHPGHNKNDFMVPFFPLIEVGQQYKPAEEWGYKYDNLVDALIEDDTIADCSNTYCPVCDASGTCINCTSQTTCPAPEGDNGSIGLNFGFAGFFLPLLLASIIFAF